VLRGLPHEEPGDRPGLRERLRLSGN
jgi:hypothetical protein